MKKSAREFPLSQGTHWERSQGQGWKARSTTQAEGLTENQITRILTRDFQPSEAWESKCLLFELTQCGVFLQLPELANLQLSQHFSFPKGQLSIALWVNSQRCGGFAAEWSLVGLPHILLFYVHMATVLVEDSLKASWMSLSAGVFVPRMWVEDVMWEPACLLLSSGNYFSVFWGLSKKMENGGDRESRCFVTAFLLHV